MLDSERLKQHMENGKPEFVMCAANYYNDGLHHHFQPYNIHTGFVIGGWRHSNAGHAYLAANLKAKSWDRCIQGFLTTKNRFLTRAQALEVVKENGQLTKPIIGGELTSEDLW